MSLKKKIAGLFESFADLLEFKGENPFKINAFRNGAAVINGLEGSLEEMISDGSIKDVKGIGKGLLAIIHEYNEKGYSSEFEKLVAEVPAGIMDFLLIRGLGAKKIKNLYESLGVSSVEELESACKDNRVAALKGFGRKTQDMILGEIERIKSVQKLTLMDDAEKKVRLILTALSTFESVKKIEVSGEYRRACEIISKLEFVVLITDFDNFNKELVSNFAFEDVVVSDYQGNDWPTGKNSVMMKAFVIEQEFIVPVYFISTLTLKDYETLLFFSTGSPEFIKACGAENTQFDEESEPEIFNKLNSPYVI
ncbi:MAG: helix-hairpin-helix domain-containing protein, partial [Clostridiales bacterium]